jgi:hypothetical protein
LQCQFFNQNKKDNEIKRLFSQQFACRWDDPVRLFAYIYVGMGGATSPQHRITSELLQPPSCLVVITLSFNQTIKTKQHETLIYRSPAADRNNILHASQGTKDL